MIDKVLEEAITKAKDLIKHDRKTLIEKDFKKQIDSLKDLCEDHSYEYNHYAVLLKSTFEFCSLDFKSSQETASSLKALDIKLIEDDNSDGLEYFLLELLLFDSRMNSTSKIKDFKFKIALIKNHLKETCLSTHLVLWMKNDFKRKLFEIGTPLQLVIGSMICAVIEVICNKDNYRTGGRPPYS